MQNLKRLKPYKSERPLRTINKIRNILGEHDIFTIESHIIDDADFHSCHVTFDNSTLASLGIATNGKGLSREYSLASGYAEFLERIQNNAKIHLQNYQATKRYLENENMNNAFHRKLKQEDLVQDFRFAPDEKFLNIEKAVNEQPDIYQKILNLNDNKEIIQFIEEELCTNEIETVPFYEVNSNEIKELPIRLIQNVCGTNGMCSGNNKIEAILQGISEIFERYAIREIYLKELSLPTIPLEVFMGNEIYERIKKLELEKSYTFIIKDCSLGIGLPVLGALIIDHSNSTYTLHLGADPSPITALERCFTEVYQGGKNARFKPVHYNTKDIFSFLGANNQKSREWNKLNQMYKTIKQGTGYWPDSIFLNKESYSFNGFENPVSYSNEKDMNYFLNIIERNNYKLFIRDHSFLGFDSFYIYIPELSHLYNIADNNACKIDYKLKQKFTILANLNKANENDIKQVVELIEEDYNHPRFSEKNIRQYFLANLNFEFVDMSPELFLVMLNYRIQNFDKAFYFLNKHLINCKSENNINYAYLYAISEYLKLKIEKNSNEDIFNRLRIQFTENMANDVINDMDKYEEIFKYHRLPSCFDCDNCPVSNECKFFDLLKCYKPIKTAYKVNVIDQNDLSKLFYNTNDIKTNNLFKAEFSSN